jgi:uncharacterized protein (DUF433 family)
MSALASRDVCDDYFMGTVRLNWLFAPSLVRDQGSPLPRSDGPGIMNLRPAMKNFERITVDPAQMGGVPCIRHLRIPVATVLRLLAGGVLEDEILAEYPDLERADIRECLRFAAASAMERELPLPPAA